tara:strand:- start:966 stop:1457 length:492 start_codon:yes stop_codon:yes gene_type:complete
VSCEAFGGEDQRRAALADLRMMIEPAPVEWIEEWLAELSVLTAGRGREGLDAELMVTAFASRLRAYPADVVKDTLLRRAWKWFPSWEELEKICNALASPRRHMIAALEGPEPKRPPMMRRATQEEKDRMQAMIDEMFPGKSAAERRAAVDEAMKGDCMRVDPE